MMQMPKPPTPDTSNGRAFGLYGDDLAIRWSRKTVERFGVNLDQIAKKIGDAIHQEGRAFVSPCTVRYRRDKVTFWASLHSGSGYYLVNAFLHRAGILYPIPSEKDVVDRTGWNMNYYEIF